MEYSKYRIKKINSYDVLDYKELENYLSEMALKGWFISDITNLFITFEKGDSKVMKFFVDITDKKIMEDNYLASKEYKEELEEKKLEYICGNDKLQIFINKGSYIKLEKNKLKFIRVFKQDFLIIISIIFALINVVNPKAMLSQSFKYYLSSNLLILWMIIGLSFLVINAFLILSKTIKYKKMMKMENLGFDDVRKSKKTNNLRKYNILNSSVFLVITGVVLLTSEFGVSHTVSTDKLPLKLEDLNMDIREIRESNKFSNSSFLAKYYVYQDTTYDEIVSNDYDEESNSYYDVFEDKNFRYLSYSIFESEYDKIIDISLQSIFDDYVVFDDYGEKSIKPGSKEEVKKWGAKEVYSCYYLGEKIVVYENMIITVGIGEELGVDEINTIKDKLLD